MVRYFVRNVSKNTTILTLSLFLLSATVCLATDDLKNHAPEKRQDDSFLFFGGWRPIKPGNPFYQGLRGGKYEYLSQIPETLDTSSTYYSSSSERYRDIFSYYPKPAFKSAHKSKAPTYMEKYKKQKKPQKHDQGGFQTLKIPGLEGIDLHQLKGLHEALISAHQIPLANFQQGNNLRFVELAVQPHQDGSTLSHYGGGGGGSSKNHGNQYGLKNGHHGRNNIPISPINLDYLTGSKLEVEPLLNYGLPNGISILPEHLGKKGLPIIPIPSIQEGLDLKNIQIVEVPAGISHSGFEYDRSNTKPRAAPAYGTRTNGGSRDYYNVGHSPKKQQQKQQQQFWYPAPYMTPHIAPKYSQPVYEGGNYGKYQQQQQHQQKQQQPQKQQEQHPIQAQLITINDEEIKNLLKNIQIVDKHSNEILRYVPLSETKKHKDGEVHLLLALPQEHGKHEQKDHNVKHDDGYQQVQLQIIGNPQQNEYESNEHGGKGHGLQGGYHVVEELHNLQNNYETGGDYQSHHDGNDQQSYTEEKSAGYTEHDNKQTSYHDQGGHKNDYAQQHNAYEGEHQQNGYEQQQIIDLQRGKNGQAFIQLSGHIDENGYKREPVLAVELKHGQTIEDAIQALDPETLQRIGAHTKDGVEIEVVEVPVDDYASESKKAEVVVPRESVSSRGTTLGQKNTRTSTTSKSSAGTTSTTRGISTTTPAPTSKQTTTMRS